MFALSFLSQELVVLLVVRVVCDQGEHQVYEFVTDIVDDNAVWLSLRFEAEVVVAVYAVVLDGAFRRLRQRRLQQGAGVALDVCLLVDARS